MTVPVPGTHDWADLLDRGLVSLPEAVATVDDVTRAGGERVLALRLAGGLALDVLPDRGLDLGATWWAGVPVAWLSTGAEREDCVRWPQAGVSATLEGRRA